MYMYNDLQSILEKAIKNYKENFLESVYYLDNYKED